MNLSKNWRVFRNPSRWAIVVGVLLLVPGALLAQVRPGNGGFDGGTRPPATDEAFNFHVLSRLTFGATEQALAEIKKRGADAWIEGQLNPGGIDDSAFEARLAADVPPVTDPNFDWDPFFYSHIARATYSERQLQEVMLQFWENHFDSVVARGNNAIERYDWTRMERLENDAFRTNAFGRFRDLVEISAKSQAMMFFLDNYRNNVASGNENYARELLELHTLGVDCGYNQTDVQEVARVWTGWTGVYISPVRPNPCVSPGNPPGCNPLHTVEADFFFNGQAHDFSEKWPDPATKPAGYVPGILYPPTTYGAGDGLQGGERILDRLTMHPCTARFITWKLIQAFVMDNPATEYVDRISDVFLKTDGDIREVLRAMFRSPEFRNPANFGGKVRTPFEFTLAAVRGVEGSINPGQKSDYEYVETWYMVRAQGMSLFDFAIPTGYAEAGPKWISANGFLQRWKYTERLMNWYPPSNNDRPTWSDPMRITVRARLTKADEVIDHFSRVLLGMTLDPTRRALLRNVLVDPVTMEFNPSQGSQNGRLREMLEQLLGFPEFNKQ